MYYLDEVHTDGRMVYEDTEKVAIFILLYAGVVGNLALAAPVWSTGGVIKVHHLHSCANQEMCTV